MKGDVGMSLHKKKLGTRRCLDQHRKSIRTSLCLCAMQQFCRLWVLGMQLYMFVDTGDALVNVYTIKQGCRDRVINDFLSRFRHLLVPLLFREVTHPYIPLHFREMIFQLVYRSCACLMPVLLDLTDTDRHTDTQIKYL